MDTNMKASKGKRASTKASKGKSAPMPNRMWRVTLAITHEGKDTAWTTEIPAPTIKRAVREARAVRRALKRPGVVTAVAGVADKHLASLPVEIVGA